MGLLEAFWVIAIMATLGSLTWTASVNLTSPGLPCGVLWYVHIPKTGGTAIAHALTRTFGEERIVQNNDTLAQTHTHDKPWILMDTYKDFEDWMKLGKPIHAWPFKSPKMSDWESSRRWKQALQELSGDTPRLVIHHHIQMKGLASLLLQIQEINETLNQKGCRLVLATTWRDPVRQMESHMHYWNQIGHYSPRITPQNTNITQYTHGFADEFSNGQSYFILTGDTVSVGLSEQNLLRYTMNTLNHVDIVGREEKLSDFTSQLGTLLGVEITLRHENEVKKRLFDIEDDDFMYMCERLRVDEKVYRKYFPGSTTKCSQLAEKYNSSTLQRLP
jgi:hypothetical protein